MISCLIVCFLSLIIRFYYKIFQYASTSTIRIVDITGILMSHKSCRLINVKESIIRMTGYGVEMDKERIKFLKKDYVQGFVAFCGFEVLHIEKGLFESRLTLRKDHKQQDGFIHAGVIATMADHTAGYSAFTLVPDDHQILTIEFKINYFKPAVGDELICRARVINQGKKIMVSESEVFSASDKNEKLVSKAMVTMMSVPASNLKNSLSE
jgi:uncharacterized protein (TIGR00369 family)